VESLLLGDGETILEGEILFTKKERDAFARIGEVKRLPSQVPVQHNQIDRVSGSTGEGMLFYQNEVFFQHGAGLWSMLRTSQAIFNSYIRPALRYLADTGLGAKRTSGKGHFYISYETMAALPASSKANGVLMLSRFLPAKDELINPEKHPLAYKLVTLRPKREQHIPAQVVGRATPPIYKRAVRAFEPGSVFPLTMRREIYGRLEELVTPAEGGPVLQGGFALPVFLWVEEEHDGK
jgi:CRISPR type III-A-associated RAMP protein Csm4